MNWRKVLADLDVPDGFIPTNEGMRTSEDLVSDLTYYNYAHNRSLGMTPEGWKRMVNYGIDNPEVLERNNAKVDAMEKRYLNETQDKRN